MLMAGCAGHGRGGAQGPAAPPYVATSIATFGAIHPASQLAGIIAPYENVAIQTTLVEAADGVYVQEGDTVYRGEVLARLDTADLQAQLAADEANTSHAVYQGGLSISQAVNTLQQAETTLHTDQLNLTRDRALLSHGYLSQQTYDNQLEVVRNDEQAVRTAQANVQANGSIAGSGLQAAAVAQARAAAEQVRVQMAKATIVSPIDGVVVNRNLNPGEYPGNRQIFTIQQIDPVYAVVHGSGVQIAHVAVGAPATVDASDLGLRAPGTVVGVLNEIVPGSTDFTVKVLLHNPQRRLRPGMSVQASVALPALRGVRVPESAFTDENHTAIMTVDAQHVIHVAQVNEIGNDGVTSVVTGIASGTRVVNNGLASVGSGQKVSLQ